MKFKNDKFTMDDQLHNITKEILLNSIASLKNLYNKLNDFDDKANLDANIKVLKQVYKNLENK